MYPDFFDSAKLVAQYDPEVADAMDLELGRQRRNIELIASENFVSPAVMTAAANSLTSLKILLSSAQKSSSARTAPTFSRTLVRRQTWRHIPRS